MRDIVNRPSPPKSTDPVVVIAPLTEMPLAVTLPLADRLDAIADDAVKGPVDTLAPVTPAELLRPAAVSELPVRIVPAVISAAVKEPLRLVDAAVTAPTCMLTAVTADAVTVPEAVMDDDRRVPVTLAELATREPATVVVRVTSLPSTIEDAATPTRTTPLVAPVPASRMRSPPVELEWPAACASR